MRAQIKGGGYSQRKSPSPPVTVSESELGKEGILMEEQTEVRHELGKHLKRERRESLIHVL